MRIHGKRKSYDLTSFLPELLPVGGNIKMRFEMQEKKKEKEKEKKKEKE